MLRCIVGHLLTGVGKAVVLYERIESGLFGSIFLAARPWVMFFPVVHLEFPRLCLVEEPESKKGAYKLSRLQGPIDSKLDVVRVHAIQVAVWLIGGNPQNEGYEGKRALRAKLTAKFFDLGMLENAGAKPCVRGHSCSAFSQPKNRRQH